MSSHITESTYLQMASAIGELLKIIAAMEMEPGAKPLTYNDITRVNKAANLREIALRELRNAGVIAPGGVT